MTLILSTWTVLVAIAFVLIAVWVYSPGRKKIYEADARIPFDGEDDLPPPSSQEQHDDA